MKIEKNVFSKVLGLVLSAGKNDQNKLLYQIDPNWFNIRFHKDCYDAMLKVSETEHIDILNLVQWLRDNNRLHDEYAYKISTLQNEVGTVELLNPNAIFNDCYYFYSVRQINLMVQNVNNELLKDSPNSQIILKEIERGKEVLTLDHNSYEEDNKLSIQKVLDLHEKAKNGLSIGVDLGWDNVKRYINLEDDDVMICGGRPAMGKTAWAISLIRNIVFDQEKSLIFFSLEMSKERIMRRIISLILDIDSNKIKFGECSPSEINKINKLKSDKRWDKLHILDGSHSVNDIQREVLKISGSEKIDLIVVDYLQKILAEKNDSRYQEVTKISNGIKRLVMSVRIPIIALAQLNRDVARSGKRPSLPDLKESGEIEQDASIVTFLHRPEYYGEMTDENGTSTQGLGEFIIAKNRDGMIGIEKMDVNLSTSNWSEYTIKPKKTFDVHSVQNYYDPS
jgi:replicative DNA helicase